MVCQVQIDEISVVSCRQQAAAGADSDIVSAGVDKRSQRRKSGVADAVGSARQIKALVL